MKGRGREKDIMIKIKRVYDKPEESDGFRVLVDRLWPRGISKKEAAVSAWCKELAPSTALRSWFGHDPARWEEFRKRYQAELAAPEKRALLAELVRRSEEGPVTLLYAARDPVHNNAAVLAEFLTSFWPKLQQQGQ